MKRVRRREEASDGARTSIIRQRWCGRGGWREECLLRPCIKRLYSMYTCRVH